MSKLVLTDIANRANDNSFVANINANNQQVVAAIENTLSRNGAAPNQMGAALDMNSERIINLPQAVDGHEPVRVMDLGNALGPVGTMSLQNAANVNITGGTIGNSVVALLSSSSGLPLSTGVTGNLSVSHLNNGTDASASTFWRGDGTWAAIAGTVVSIVTYGGDPTGVADTLAAWNAAVADLPSKGGVIYFPKGLYLFSASPQYTFTTAQASLKVYGDGPGSSILTFPNSHGFQFHWFSPLNSVCVSDLKLLAGTAGGSIALSLLRINPSVDTNPGSFSTSVIRNVQLYGSNDGGGGGTNFWTYGFYIAGVSGTNISDCTVWGSGEGEGIVYSGLSNLFSVQHNLVNFSAANVLDGILIGTKVQGVQIINANVIATQDGVQVSSGGSGVAEISIQNSQITSNVGVNVFSVVNNLAVLNNPFLACTVAGIKVENIAVTGIISGNQIVANTLGSGIGILLKSLSGIGGYGGMNVSDNTISGFATAVSLTATSSSVTIGWNTGFSNTVFYSNVGTANILPTGTGSPVQAISPTLVTPNLGVPSAIDLTHGAGLPLTTGVTGTLPVTNGGTGDTGTAWTITNPTVTSQGGTPANVTAVVSSKRIGKTAFVTVNVTFTNVAGGSGYLSVPMPFTAFSTSGFGGQNGATNVPLIGLIGASGASMFIFGSGNTFPGANGQTAVVSGSFETA